MLVVHVRIKQLLVILFIIKLNALKKIDYKFCKPSVNDYFLVYELNSVYLKNFTEFSILPEQLLFSLVIKFY